ncbi:MAG: GNAT family N-acetyltransferase [Actinomycetota bacterium]|nr:GNAT family N-acetyltransferase [Actinomycetota bacterium]
MTAESVRLAVAQDGAEIGRLLDAFNREYGDPTPGPRALAARIVELLQAGEIDVLLIESEAAADRPAGLAALRFRPAIWTNALECYLAELYVVPAHRGHGLGRRLMLAAIDFARARGADRMDLGTSEADVVARALYESLGFVNRERPPGGPVMYVYEREL